MGRFLCWGFREGFSGVFGWRGLGLGSYRRFFIRVLGFEAWVL